ncbi:MAG: InlB B-repeat-containing protein [Clostridia bacterium]|nr:InlB B-repeat-containing protein [Clostridia bacterium]
MAKGFKKTLLIALICLIVSAASLGLAACKKGDDTPTTYTLSFNSNGGSSVDSITLEEGKAVTLPASTKTNYAFCGWYFDNNTFNDVANGTTLKYLSVKSDLTVYAKWEALDLTRDGVYGANFDVKVTDSIILDSAPDGFAPTFETNLSKEESVISIINGKRYLDLVVYGSEDFGFFQEGMRYKVTYKGMPLSVYTGDARINSMDMANAEGRRQLRLPLDDDSSSATISVKEVESGGNMYMVVDCATYNVTINFSDITYKAYAVQNDKLEDGIYTVDTHALGVGNGVVSMNENFNDVRAYIVVSNGKMKMYKTFQAYMGMTGLPYGKEAYFNMMATYTAYEFITPVSDVWNDDGKFNSEFTKKDLVAVDTWFDAQSGTYTYSWDVTDWRDSYVVTGTVTGFMLEAMAMASSETLLYVDTATLIKTDDVSLPAKPSGSELKWTTKAIGNVVSTADALEETWQLNFVWQGGLDSDIADRQILSFTSRAVPYIDEVSGEVYADVEYVIYNADLSQDILSDAVRVTYKLGQGNSYNTGSRQNVLITNAESDNKDISLQLTNVDWLIGKSFNQDNEMYIMWRVGESYDVPEASITVDGFEFSLMKEDSSGDGTLAPGAGYRLYASADKVEWIDASDLSGFLSGKVKSLTGSSAYKYYRVEMSVKDQYGEDVRYIINITVQELEIEWGLAQGDNSGVDVEDNGVLIRANAGDTINVPEYTYKVGGEEKTVAVTAYVYTATTRSLISGYQNGASITVDNDAYLIVITYTGRYLNTTADQCRYVYIAVNGKLDIGDITAAQSVEKGENAYFIAPTVKIDGKQVAANMVCKSFGRNGLNTSYTMWDVATQTDRSGHTYAVAGDETLYLCLNITCGKVAGDGSAFGYSWSVTLNAISKIIVNQPAAE